MNKYFCTFLALFSTLFVGATCQAELKKCHGVWTNKPCEGQVEGAIAEATSVPRAPGAVELDRKKLWIHDLDTKRFGAKQQYGLDFDLSEARKICLESPSSLSDCRKAVDDKMSEIDSKLQSTAERKRAEAEISKPTPAQQPNITIINQHQENKVVIERRATPTPLGGVNVGAGVDIGNIVGGSASSKKPRR